MGSSEPADTNEHTTQTTVTVRCTGVVRDAVGTGTLEYTFEGDTLRAFLTSFFEEYPIADLLLAPSEAEATAHGWAPTPATLPGTWRANPAGDQTKPFARVLINGRFNEHLGGLDARLSDGDRIALMKPFVFCV